VAVYCATKAAVISLTQSAGLILIKHGINVNAIAPGVVDGEHWDGVDALFAKYEGSPGPEEARGGSGRALRPHGPSASRPDRGGGVPCLVRARITSSHRRAEAEAAAMNVDGGQRG
jgi:galactitol 2-dehydrogenase